MLLLLTGPGFAAAGGDQRGSPFVAAHAAGQNVITSQAMQHEIEQFRYLSELKTAQARNARAQLHLQQAHRDYVRAEALFRMGAISQVQFATAYFKYRTFETDVIRSAMEINKARMSAQFYKLRVLEEGNPGIDYRAQIAEATIEELKSEIESILSSLNLVKTGRQLAQQYLNHGQELLNKQALSPQAWEYRDVAFKDVLIEQQDLQEQLKLARETLASFELVKGRLAR
ncbi:MAG: hypothetical protein AB7G93_20875 [Bdellovibrionales bacterium]